MAITPWLLGRKVVVDSRNRVILCGECPCVGTGTGTGTGTGGESRATCAVCSQGMGVRMVGTVVAANSYFDGVAIEFLNYVPNGWHGVDPNDGGAPYPPPFNFLVNRTQLCVNSAGSPFSVYTLPYPGGLFSPVGGMTRLDLGCIAPNFLYLNGSFYLPTANACLSILGTFIQYTIPLNAAFADVIDCAGDYFEIPIPADPFGVMPSGGRMVLVSVP